MASSKMEPKKIGRFNCGTPVSGVVWYHLQLNIGALSIHKMKTLDRVIFSVLDTNVLETETILAL